MGARILVVEDDTMLREGIVEFLEREGYEAVAARDCASARIAVEKGPELVLLDVMLPDGDGFSLCRELRGAGVLAPIVFLTACDEETDVVRGLDSGADDYIAKPFRIRELASRVRARLRGREEPELYTNGGLTIDFTARRATLRGAEISLTPTEFKLLCALARGGGRTVTRETLLGRIWDDAGSFIDDNTLSVHIRRLREKVGTDRIRTVRGFGYQWTEEEG